MTAVSAHSPAEIENSYVTALLIGRAFALANSHHLDVPDPAVELCRLAAGGSRPLLRAHARLAEYSRRRASVEDRHALDLLADALALTTDSDTDPGRIHDVQPAT